MSRQNSSRAQAKFIRVSRKKHFHKPFSAHFIECSSEPCIAELYVSVFDILGLPQFDLYGFLDWFLWGLGWGEGEGFHERLSWIWVSCQMRISENSWIYWYKTALESNTETQKNGETTDSIVAHGECLSRLTGLKEVMHNMNLLKRDNARKKWRDRAWMVNPNKTKIILVADAVAPKRKHVPPWVFKQLHT